MLEERLGVPQTEDELVTKISEWLQNFPASAPLVVVPVYNAYEDVVECIESILADKTGDTPLLLVDDASPDTRIQRTFEPLASARGFLYVRKPANSGFVGSANLAFKASAPHDVVLVNSDLVLPSGWLERLRAAAYTRSTVATATPLTNNGSIVSVPYRNKSLDYIAKNLTVAQADAKILATSLKLRPIIPTAIGHCTYFKRLALEVVGYFDEAFAPGYGEEVDFSQRAVMSGFCHVLADDLFVYHKGSRSFGKDPAAKKGIQQAHEQIIAARYPWYHRWVNEAQSAGRSPLAVALFQARSAMLGRRIAIDATCINEAITGTQVLTLELINALATSPERGDTHITVIMNDTVPRKALLGVDKVVDEVMRFTAVYEKQETVYDVIYRPFQVYSIGELELLKQCAARFVISQLDCISFSNPTYYSQWEKWAELRTLTQLTFAAADGVTFISADGAQDATQQGLYTPDYSTAVTYVGVDHKLYKAEPKAPANSQKLLEKPFVLVIGTNFKHKNRAFALKMLKVLRDEYNWDGNLVFAGPEVPVGGSGSEESFEKLQDAKLNERLINLGAVTESEKNWLMEKAALLLYPSVYEGFGIPPFEAALLGTPALTTRATSLGEVLGEDVVYLESLDPATSAVTVWQMLNDPQARQQQIAAIKARATSEFSWAKVAERTWQFLYAVANKPVRLRHDAPQEVLAHLKHVQNEYQNLEKWAASLNQSLNSITGKPGYKLLSKIKQI